MGLFDLFGSTTEGPTGGSDGETDEQKYAILLNAGPDAVATGGNAFNYAIELDQAGYEVQLFLDGTATKWPREFVNDPDRPYNYEWSEIRRRGLLVGACGYCANAFDAADACQRSDVRLLSDSGEHAPSVAQLADEGYEIVAIG